MNDESTVEFDKMKAMKDEVMKGERCSSCWETYKWNGLDKAPCPNAFHAAPVDPKPDRCPTCKRLRKSGPGMVYPGRSDITWVTCTNKFHDAPTPAPQDEAAERLRREALEVADCIGPNLLRTEMSVKVIALADALAESDEELRSVSKALHEVTISHQEANAENAALLKRAEAAERIPDACPYCGDTTFHGHTPCDAVPGR